MAPGDPSDIQNQVNWNKYIELVSIVILYYDYFLTLDLEIERYWKRRTWGLGSVLFYVNRYLTLFGNVPILLFFFWPELLLQHDEGCRKFEHYQQFFLSMVQLVISILFVLRTYALYGQSKVILVLMISAVTGMVGNGLLQWYLSTKDENDIALVTSVQVGCLQSNTAAQGLHMIYLWLGVLCVDILVFTLTLRKTIAERKIGFSGLVYLFLRDGVLYFGIITIINSANILVFALGRDYMKSLLPVLANVIASVMMSHLMLNLRDELLDETPGLPKVMPVQEEMVFEPNRAYSIYTYNDPC